jgi:hypothetical protein
MRTHFRSLHLNHGRYFVVLANVGCAYLWLRVMAKISRRWRELRLWRFRLGSLALLLVIGIVWSSVLGADLFSFYGQSVSVDAVVPQSE